METERNKNEKQVHIQYHGLRVDGKGWDLLMGVWGALLAVSPVTSGQVEVSLEELKVDELHRSSQREVQLDPCQTA